MGTEVRLQSLAGAIARYRFAYLMTTSGKGAPHVVQVVAKLEGGELLVSGFGRRTRENAQARPSVALVWPPLSEADYSLIVDGQAGAVGESLRVMPTRAVLHRPGPASTAGGAGSCGSDCVELELPS